MGAFSFPTVNCLQMPGNGGAATPSVLRPLEKVLHGVAAGGFTHVGIDNFSVRDHVRCGAGLDRLRDLLDRLELTCSDVGVLRIGDPETTVAAAGEMSRLAAATGAAICTTALDVVPGPQAVDTLRRCADVLAAEGIRMALEFLPYSPLSTLRAARAVCAAVGVDRCGVLIDTWMFFRGDNSFAELEQVRAEEIGYVQFDDAPRPAGADVVRESRHRRVVPGAGTFDLARFAAAVVAAGFDGLVSIEVLSADFRALEPVEQARRALASARSCWPAISQAAKGIPA